MILGARRTAGAASAQPRKRQRLGTSERRPLKKSKVDAATAGDTTGTEEQKEQESLSEADDAADSNASTTPLHSSVLNSAAPLPPASTSASSAISTASSRHWDNLRPSLHPLLLSYIASRGFDQMTPVQAATIPLFSSYKDVCVQAVTGSGKTLAFLLPILQRLMTLAASTPLDSRKVYALIITPTRELALQIHDEVQRILTFIQATDTDTTSSSGAAKHITASAIIGGHTTTAQPAAAATHILTATPGRLEHLLGTSQLNVSALEVLVLDEADRLLELGFEGSVDNIMKRLPKQRRTGLFSATQTTAVKQLSRAGLRNPVIVDVSVAYKADKSAMKAKRGGESTDERKDSVANGGLLPVQATPQSLQNYYHVLSPALKLTYLIDFLLAHRTEKVIVFFLTCACVDYFHLLLKQLPSSSHLSYIALHGHKTQKQRKTALAAFKRPRVPQVLLSTDVAARGVDIEDVRWIVQFDAPLDAAVFVHRIGRTARMGREGESLLLLAPNEDAYIPYLHRMHVPITPFLPSPPLPPSSPSVSPLIKQLALADRAVFESAQSAVVSYIRAYKEHQLSLLFRVQEMRWEEVGAGYGLLMWPVLPDLKWLRVQYESGLEGVKGRDIRYKDGKKEKDRLARMEVEGVKRKVEKQQREEDERELRKRRQERQSSRAIKERRKDRTPHGQIEKEWKGLQKEANLMKKLRTKQITKAEYERLEDQADDAESAEDELNGSEASGGESGSD